MEFLVSEGGRFVVELPEDGFYASRQIEGLGLDLAALMNTVDARLGLD